MLVLAVGKNSQAGIIKSLVSGSEHQDDEEAVSVLGAKLEVLAQQIGYVGSAFATVCVLLLASRFGYNLYAAGEVSCLLPSSWAMNTTDRCIVGVAL